MQKLLIAGCLFLLIGIVSMGQVSYSAERGKKANYTIEIPSTFVAKPVIGANVDLKFGNAVGASIVTVVRQLPVGMPDNFIKQLPNQTEYQAKEQMEASGLEDVTIIKRGIVVINGVESFYNYYTTKVDGVTLYYHSISQCVNRKMIVLTLTCEYSEKYSYMAYFNRVVNSLKYH